MKKTLLRPSVWWGQLSNNLGMKNFIFFLILFVSVPVGLFAQFPPRDEDQLKRQKVVNSIPLNEKMNKPLIYPEELIYTKPRYSETKGIIEALLNGVKNNKYVAYRADSLTWAAPLTWNDVVKLAKSYEDKGAEAEGESTEGGGTGFEDFGGEDAGAGGEGAAGGEDALAAAGGGGSGRWPFDLAPYTDKMEIIEDRIFDKKRSDVYHDIQFINLIWVDPGNVRPNKNFVSFKYTDVMAQLDDTQWKNHKNDQEYRSMREVIELRMFHSYILSVSGTEVEYLDQAEYRRNQIVEYEHNLWHY